MPLAILVEFELEQAAAETFMPLIRANADASLRDEPGCFRFDVLHDPALPDRVVLYELYDDAPAFEAHLHTSHYATFRQASAGLVRHQTVRRLELA